MIEGFINGLSPSLVSTVITTEPSSRSSSKENDVVRIDEIPTDSTVHLYLTKQKGSLSALQHLDAFEQLLNKPFETGEVTEYGLLEFCDQLSNYLNLGEIYLEDKFICVLGKKFDNKDELLIELPRLVREAVEQETLGMLYTLAEMAGEFEYAQNGKAVILDGVAYVADSMSTLAKKDSNYYIEGYMKNGKVHWSSIDKSRFRPVEAEAEGNGKKDGVTEIFLLETLYHSDLYIVYRSVLEKEKNKVVRSPYPVAILEDGEYAFYFETKEGSELDTNSADKWYSKFFKSKEFE